MVIYPLKKVYVDNFNFYDVNNFFYNEFSRMFDVSLHRRLHTVPSDYEPFVTPSPF